MKKILILFGLFLLFSCEKEPSYCWVCYKDIKTPNSTQSNQVDLCGLSEKEIGTTIAENTYTQGTTQYSMRCSKKQ